MFLSKFNNKEKEAFCKLANYVACVDGIVKEEIETLAKYNQEMGTNYNFKDKIDDSLDELVNKFSESSNEVKKVVAFELIGLANVDSDYSKNEIKCVNDICSKLGLDEKTIKRTEEVVTNLLKVYNDIVSIIEE